MGLRVGVGVPRSNSGSGGSSTTQRSAERALAVSGRRRVRVAQLRSGGPYPSPPPSQASSVPPLYVMAEGEGAAGGGGGKGGKDGPPRWRAARSRKGGESALELALAEAHAAGAAAAAVEQRESTHPPTLPRSRRTPATDVGKSGNIDGAGGQDGGRRPRTPKKVGMGKATTAFDARMGAQGIGAQGIGLSLLERQVAEARARRKSLSKDGVYDAEDKEAVRARLAEMVQEASSSSDEMATDTDTDVEGTSTTTPGRGRQAAADEDPAAAVVTPPKPRRKRRGTNSSAVVEAAAAAAAAAEAALAAEAAAASRQLAGSETSASSEADDEDEGGETRARGTVRRTRKPSMKVASKVASKSAAVDEEGREAAAPGRQRRRRSASSSSSVGSGALWEQRVAAWEQSAEGETLSRSVMELIDAMRTGQTQSSIPRLTATEELELGVSSAELLRIESIRTTLVEQRVGREIAEAAERGVAAVAMPAPGSLKEPAERTLAAAATLTVGGLREATRAGQHAREMLVQSNLRLVGWVANRYAGGKHGLSLEDLVQEGTVGLMKGAERYDPSRGYRFSTYAMHWVRASVHRAVMMQGRTIRLPVKLQELNNQIMRGRGELELQLGREPEEEALALHLGITVQRIRDVMRWTLDSVSLETVVDSVKSQAAGRPLRLADSVEGGDDDAGEPRCGSAERVEGDVERDLLRTELENLLDTLLPVRPPSLISLSSHQVVERSHSHTRPLLTPCRSVRVWMMFGCSVSGTSCACGTDWTTRHPSRARRCRGCWVCPRKPSSSTRRAVSRSCATRSAPPT